MTIFAYFQYCTLAYISRGGGQKWLKMCLRNTCMVPKLSVDLGKRSSCYTWWNCCKIMLTSIRSNLLTTVELGDSELFGQLQNCSLLPGCSLSSCSLLPGLTVNTFIVHNRHLTEFSTRLHSGKWLIYTY